MFKKTMAVIMTAALMLGLAACGSKGEVKEEFGEQPEEMALETVAAVEDLKAIQEKDNGCG